jgi:hypothetical protein
MSNVDAASREGYTLYILWGTGYGNEDTEDAKRPRPTSEETGDGRCFGQASQEQA